MNKKYDYVFIDKLRNLICRTVKERTSYEELFCKSSQNEGYSIKVPIEYEYFIFRPKMNIDNKCLSVSSYVIEVYLYNSDLKIVTYEITKADYDFIIGEFIEKEVQLLRKEINKVFDFINKQNDPNF
jgi:hypothetical protein